MLPRENLAPAKQLNVLGAGQHAIPCSRFLGRIFLCKGYFQVDSHGLVTSNVG